MREPLEYLFADHVRLQTFCQAIGQLAEDLDDDPKAVVEKADTLEVILSYLRDELPRHIADEEIDIIPLLKMRAWPEDNFDKIIGQIGKEHAEDEERTETLVQELEIIERGKRLEDPKLLVKTARQFAEGHCHHLRWENSTLLPLARKRLTDEDQKQIGRTMAKRRGVPYPD